MDLTQDRERLAKLLFSLDATLGILSIGAAALYGATWSSRNAWVAFLSVFVPGSALFAAFCYGAFRGLTSKKLALQCLFWLFVVGNAPGFPVGTAIAGAAVWLWREARTHGPPPSAGA